MPAVESLPHRASSLGPRAIVAVVAFGAFVLAAPLASPVSAGPADAPVESLQRTVDGLRSRLGITRPVIVSVVSANPRVLSMTPPAEGHEAFGLEIDATFLEKLTDDEVAAALAHELGHVWVSTNRPFLQTERLANDVAMRVVTRWSLVRVYRKLSAHTGMAADETAYLGPEILKVARRDSVD